MTTEGRKRVILIADSGKVCQSEYKRAFSDTAILKQVFTADDAMHLVINHFKNGVILAVDATIEQHLDGLKIVELATMLARGNRFVPVIIAIASNEEDNKKMLEAGCTHKADKKSDVVSVIRNHGVSKAPRENRAIGFR